MYRLIFFIIILKFTLMAQSNQEEMKKLLWIVDSWRSVKDEEVSAEKWIKINDSLFEGESTTTVKNEVVFREKLKIENTPGGIFYTADVPHNPGPVRFKLITVNDTMAVFENPEHDFPQKITYINETGNLHAFIEGPAKDGKMKKIDFYFLKER